MSASPPIADDATAEHEETVVVAAAQPIAVDDDSLLLEEICKDSADDANSHSVALTIRHNQETSYRQRLATFQPITYFCKPLALSPIVCARFGWTNVKLDLLVCQHCHAAWSVSIPPQLSRATKLEQTKYHVHKLAHAHFGHCRYRREALEYLEQSPETNDDFILWFANVWPRSIVELLEHPHPTRLVWQAYGTLARALQHVPLDTILLVSVPDNVRTFSLTLDDKSDEDAQETLLSRIYKVLRKENSKEQPLRLPVAMRDIVLTLVLLGWTLAKNDSEDTPSGVCLQCPLCFARMNLDPPPPPTSLRSSLSPPTKRPRIDVDDRRTTRETRHDPWKRHCYYCPYVAGMCGPSLTTSTPFWQQTATRLLIENKPIEDDDASLRKLVRSVVSPRIPTGLRNHSLNKE